MRDSFPITPLRGSVTLSWISTSNFAMLYCPPQALTSSGSDFLQSPGIKHFAHLAILDRFKLQIDYIQVNWRWRRCNRGTKGYYHIQKATKLHEPLTPVWPESSVKKCTWGKTQSQFNVNLPLPNAGMQPEAIPAWWSIVLGCPSKQFVAPVETKEMVKMKDKVSKMESRKYRINKTM